MALQMRFFGFKQPVVLPAATELFKGPLFLKKAESDPSSAAWTGFVVSLDQLWCVVALTFIAQEVFLSACCSSSSLPSHAPAVLDSQLLVEPFPAACLSFEEA